MKRLKEFSELKTNGIAQLTVKHEQNHRNISTTPDVIECLISHTHPDNHALRNKPEISNLECLVEIKSRDRQAIHSHDTTKFDEFWELCLKRIKQDKTFQFIRDENDKLLEEARNVQKEIVKRIQEPWKI